jgi:hypothetical protein
MLYRTYPNLCAEAGSEFEKKQEPDPEFGTNLCDERFESKPS